MRRLSRRFLDSANVIAALSVVVPLLIAFRLWSFSYFWTDDFGNTFYSEIDVIARK